MKKILVIQTASIGDVILATPVLEKLHGFFPDAAVDLLVKKGNEHLFNGHPFLNEIIVWDKKNHAVRNLFSMLFRIRKKRYDLVINIQRFFKTGVLTAFSGAGMTVGFDKNPLSFFFTRRVRHQIDGIHEVQRNMMLIEEMTGPGTLRPRLYPTPSDFVHVAQFKTAMYYTMSPASLWFTKQFPVEKWSELTDLVPAGAMVFLLGSENDKDLCEKILLRSGHRGLQNLAGQLTFLQSAALMQDAKMNFTNDSAPMHLASSVNAPVTAIYCSTIPGFGFGPLSDDSGIVEIQSDLTCRPCGLHGYQACPEKHFACATGIRADQFLARL
jgi:heptosyltransferase-2